MTEPQHSPDLLLAMDCLWFFQRNLLSEPTSKPSIPLPPQPQQHSETSLESLSDFPSIFSLEEGFSFSSDASPTSPKEGTVPDDTHEAAEDNEEHIYNYMRKRPSSLSPTSSKASSRSSSPSVRKLPKHLRKVRAGSPLRKTMSCKTLFELEYEEVKGFMDLGFKFNKEELCPLMMSVLPGLQRLVEYKVGVKDEHCNAEDKLKDMDRQEKAATRPYLSEAWLIKTPDSPLLNLRIPRVSTPDGMKKHLRYWARTVASTIQVEY